MNASTTASNKALPASRLRNESFKGNIPDIVKFAGPALQQEIEAVNRAVLKLCVTAARLGEAEPLAPALLGLSRETLDELASAGRADILLAQAHGLPLVELRIKDVNTLKSVLRSGFGSQEAVSALTRSLPLELLTKHSSQRRVGR